MSERLAAAPQHLRPETRKWWQRMMATFELEAHHVELLRLAGEALDRCAEAREAIERDGAYLRDRFSQIKPHPAMTVERASSLAAAKLISELQLVELPAHEPRRGR